MNDHLTCKCNRQVVRRRLQSRSNRTEHRNADAAAIKRVYLFELDSVRATDDEIIQGQRALFTELVSHGNQVVITFNQIADSRGFFSLVQDAGYCKLLLWLFSTGRLCIARYESCRTVAQYLMERIRKSVDQPKESFVFSGLPLRSEQRFLLKLIYRELATSDLSKLDEYINDANMICEESNKGTMPNERKALHDLFREVCDGKIQASSMSCSEIHQDLVFLRKSLSFILHVSPLSAAYCNPMNWNAIADNFEVYLQAIASVDMGGATFNANRAQKIISDFLLNGNETTQTLSRSTCHERLRTQSKCRHANATAEDYALAEAMVDLAYNYQCEASVCGTSKHYDFDGFTDMAIQADKTDDPMAWWRHNINDPVLKTFCTDVKGRLASDWSDGKNFQNRYLLAHGSFAPLKADAYQHYVGAWARIPQLLMGDDRIGFDPISIFTAEDRAQNDTEVQATEAIPTYESGLFEQQQAQRRRVLKRLRFSVLTALCYLLIAFAIALVLGFLQNGMASGQWSFSSVGDTLWFVLMTIVFLLASEAVNTCARKSRIDYPSISESLQMAYRATRDLAFIHRISPTAYVNPPNSKTRCEQPRSSQRCSEHIPERIVAYETLYRENPELFRKLQSYPLVVPQKGEPETDYAKKAADYEASTGRQLGVVYESPFHLMIVDLVRDTETDRCYSYERLLPAANVNSNGGVVIAPRYRGHYVLLKQERHATRSVQICFPRGFAEQQIEPSDNAIKELSEELHAAVNGTMQLLGEITPDSGILSNRASVFTCELASFEQNTAHREGIIDVILLSSGEIDKLISEGGIDDAFTLATWTLIKASADQHTMQE